MHKRKIHDPHWAARLEGIIQRVRRYHPPTLTHECPEWDGMVINEYDPEFASCPCFDDHTVSQATHGIIAIYNEDPDARAMGINVIEPTADMVTLDSIAHAIGLTPRFGGHVRRFYSVAQHSLYVAARVPKHMRLRGLLHDASEAYLTDIPRPYKAMIPGYKLIESRVSKAIGEHFGIPDLHVDYKEVKHADWIALGHEANSFMPKEADWYSDYYIDAIRATAHLPPLLEGKTLKESMILAAEAVEHYQRAVEMELRARARLRITLGD